MTKILKNGKKLLSFVVAFAVIAVSLFVAMPAINLTASAAIGSTLKWDGSHATSLSDTTHTGTSWDDAIIISTPEEFAGIVRAQNIDTVGKYFKVADGIAEFDMQGNAWNGMFWNSTPFKGHFDGNGVKVTNLTGSSWGMGLFPCISVASGNVTIKNIAVEGASFTSNAGQYTNSAGGIFGTIFDGNVNKTVTIENCSVVECTIKTGAKNNGDAMAPGVIGGSTGQTTLVVRNCFAKGNTLTSEFDSSYSGIFGRGCYSAAPTVTNCIFLGVPAIQSSTKAVDGYYVNQANYSNVYTDTEAVNTSGLVAYQAGKIKMVSEESMKGAAGKTALAGLDFDTVWFANAGLPELRVFHKNIKATKNADTHSETCEDCNLAGLESPHYYVADYANGKSVCVCGAEISGIFDTWDGQKTEPTTTDEAGNVVIKTAEELAWVVLAGGDNTAGKNYIVVPNAQFDMMCMNDVTLNTAASELAPKSKNGTNAWDTNVWFQGNFDGNGLIVYNLYVKGSGTNNWRAGMFINVKGTDVTIKNISLRTSFFDAGSATGGLVGYFSEAQGDALSFINCEVTNCNIDGADTNDAAAQVAGGLVGAHGNSTPKLVENCAVYNNIITGKIIGAFVGSTGDHIHYEHSVEVKNSIAAGVSPMPNYTKGDTNNFVDRVKFANVYTDQAVSREGITDGITNWQAVEYTLDLANVWFANTTQAPVLRLFHNIKGTSNGASGHTAKCEDCGIEALAAEDHDWSANNGICAVCGYGCEHTNATEGDVVNAGNCTTDREVKMDCPVCGAAPNKITPAPGHTLGAQVAAQGEDCGNDGWVAHYKCSTCDGYTLSDDAMADTVDYDTDIKIAATGAHTPLMDGATPDYDINLEGFHRLVCDVCDQTYGDEAHDGEYIADGANGHSGACTKCGAGTQGVEPHIFGDDNVCDTCAWTCTEHDWDDGIVKTFKDCITDETTEYTCEICSTKKTETTDATQGHTFEHKIKVDAKCNEDGMMAYEYCTTCNKKYADGADVKIPFENKVEDADLVITERPACPTEPVQEDPATCTGTGVKAHDLCPVCGKVYLNGVLIAPEAVESTLKIDENGHKYERDSADAPIWYTTADEHWHKCEICGDVDKAAHNKNVDTATFEGTYTTCAGCDYETFEHQKSSADGNVTITAADGVFTKDVWTTITDIVSEDLIYSDIKLLLKDLGVQDMLIYDITPDEAMATGSKATVTFKVPTTFGENVAIYHVDVANQAIEKLDTTVEGKAEAKTASAQVDHFSVYVLVDLGATTQGGGEGSGGDIENDEIIGGGDYGDDDIIGDVNGDTSEQSPATAAQSVALAVALAIALIGAAFVIIRKAKKA